VILLEKDYPNIANFFRVNEKVCTGGQPAMDDLAKLKAEGVKTVINLRQAGEFNAEEEAAKVKELGLRYIWIPFSGKEPKEDVASDFLKFTADEEIFPAFIHCATNNRVGALWMIRRVLVDKWSVEDAEVEARKMGLRNQVLADFAKGYITRHRHEKAPAAKHD
jgi:uncharacterized protein (TIGR01244 family)